MSTTLVLVGGFVAALMTGRTAIDPVADLTDRLRNPRRRALWMIAHPVTAWRNR